MKERNWWKRMRRCEKKMSRLELNFRQRNHLKERPRTQLLRSAACQKPIIEDCHLALQLVRVKIKELLDLADETNYKDIGNEVFRMMIHNFEVTRDDLINLHHRLEPEVQRDFPFVVYGDLTEMKNMFDSHS